MDKTSKIWFAEWFPLENIVEKLRSKLEILEKEKGRKEDQEESEFLGDVAWGTGWKDGVKTDEEEEKKESDEEMLAQKVQLLNLSIEEEELVKKMQALTLGTDDEGFKAWLGPGVGDQPLL